MLSRILAPTGESRLLVRTRFLVDVIRRLTAKLVGGTAAPSAAFAMYLTLRSIHCITIKYNRRFWHYTVVMHVSVIVLRCTMQVSNDLLSMMPYYLVLRYFLIVLARAGMASLMLLFP